MTITLVVEDGTGLPDANTYIASADADTYWSNRANTAWAALSEDDKAAALIQATQYLDARYNFKGIQLTDTQALAWPRKPESMYRSAFGVWTDIYAGSSCVEAMFTWPVKRIKDAVCEAALRASTGALYTDEDPSIITSERVDVIAVTYAERSLNGGQVRIAIVDDILRPLLASGGNSIAVVRA